MAGAGVLASCSESFPRSPIRPSITPAIDGKRMWSNLWVPAAAVVRAELDLLPGRGPRVDRVAPLTSRSSEGRQAAGGSWMALLTAPVPAPDFGAGRGPCSREWRALPRQTHRSPLTGI
jgi:hypothetical protein